MKIDDYASLKSEISKLSHDELYKAVKTLALNVNRNFSVIEKNNLAPYSAMYNYYKSKYGNENEKQQRIKFSKSMSDAELRKTYKIALSTLRPYEYNKSAIGSSTTKKGSLAIKEKIRDKIFGINEAVESIEFEDKELEKQKREEARKELTQEAETKMLEINWSEYWKAFNAYKSLEATNAKEQSSRVLQILKDEVLSDNDITDTVKLQKKINDILEEEDKLTPVNRDKNDITEKSGFELVNEDEEDEYEF